MTSSSNVSPEPTKFGSPTLFLGEMFNLVDRTVLVTGGAGAIGGAIALAAAAAGADVIITARTEQKCFIAADRINQQVKEDRVVPYVFDALVDSNWEKLRDDHPDIDTLVCSHGGNLKLEDFASATERDDAVWNLNFRSVRVGCEVIGEKMLQNGYGCIINIASVSAVTPLSNVDAYSAAKAAVISHTKSLGNKWAPHNVRANWITPGFFPTPQNEHLLNSGDRGARILAHTPMGRYGKVHELMTAFLFLASPFSGFVASSGATVAGGFDASTI